MSQWTAVSDVDYDYECGNGDRWERPEDRDEPEERPEEVEEIDPETEHWLETHGYFDPPSDEDIGRMAVWAEAEGYLDAPRPTAEEICDRVYDAIKALADFHMISFSDAVQCIVEAEEARRPKVAA